MDNKENNKTENAQTPRNESDLPDSARDEKAMEQDEVILDLPEVSDIPGQENIVPPKMSMFADTTISSDGEEGTAIFDDEDEEKS